MGEAQAYGAHIVMDLLTVKNSRAAGGNRLLGIIARVMKEALIPPNGRISLCCRKGARGGIGSKS